MIYTITFNPALDYTLKVSNFKIGDINRTTTEKILPGGKGLNVSIVLKNLGVENTALGFLAGFTGKELKRKIEEKGIKTDFIEIENGITRINVKISSKSETAINGNGPQITEREIQLLLEKLQQINKNDIVILAGNIPKNIKNNIYEEICMILEKKGITYVVDATKELLLNILKYKPFLIKPNKEELEETFGVKIKSEEQIIIYATKMKELGAQNVLVSLGGKGAILVSENGTIYNKCAPKGEVVSTVGAGDSMVAGFIVGYLKNHNYEEALKMGIASGSASTFSENLATKEDVEQILKQI